MQEITPEQKFPFGWVHYVRNLVPAHKTKQTPPNRACHLCLHCNYFESVYALQRSSEWKETYALDNIDSYKPGQAMLLALTIHRPMLARARTRHHLMPLRISKQQNDLVGPELLPPPPRHVPFASLCSSP
jgi:hypothetical protein